MKEILAKAKERYARVSGNHDTADSQGSKGSEEEASRLLKAKTLVLGYTWPGFVCYIVFISIYLNAHPLVHEIEHNMSWKWRQKVKKTIT